ncbi:kinase-like domain-containing protein [Suillus bovinus]|uniref:kinase-like domain-containing protein n=1 Tax=Suillus bovinus TaxID=48563 RepID=UPI001B879DA0|nr:kinase-like domain-containing protein [Suillus bovinus]KAG2131262.1 kinase-like domain-containing protein [Suillus bovinus]
MSKQSTDDLVDLTERITRTCTFCFTGGGFGDIWRCTLQTGATYDEVAVKAIRFQSVEVGPSQEKALRRELGTWKRLKHTNILPLLGIATGFSPFISMVSPWCEHGSLAVYLNKYESITLSDRLRLLQDVASGLHYLHHDGIPVVHGDLTPNNVLLNDDKRAVLTDFGLSSVLGDITGFSYLQWSCAQPGVIRYSAPELLRDPDAPVQPDIRSDIYSFGCLALKVLSGNEPWADVKHWRTILIKVADGHSQQRPTCSPVLDVHWQLIQRCFLQPGARPSTHHILKILEELQSEGIRQIVSSIVD